jgi:hypothetical protein
MDFGEILKPGLKAEKSEAVTDKNTAAAWGSGENRRRDPQPLYR